MKIKGVKSTVSSVVLKVHKGPRINGDSNKAPSDAHVTETP
jgi:hypothetical protein